MDNKHNISLSSGLEHNAASRRNSFSSKKMVIALQTLHVRLVRVKDYLVMIGNFNAVVTSNSLCTHEHYFVGPKMVAREDVWVDSR
jgi:hypothetical protein